jgi:hypothetical protein
MRLINVGGAEDKSCFGGGADDEDDELSLPSPPLLVAVMARWSIHAALKLGV